LPAFINRKSKSQRPGRTEALTIFASWPRSSGSVLRTGTHLAATATFILFARHHRTFAFAATRHLTLGVLRHHGASLAILVLAAFSVLALGPILATAACVFAAGRSFAVIAAGTGLGTAVTRWYWGALSHQSQSHNDRAY
jgi:hypothetical protein